jgi:hypothetical protein
VAFGVPVKVIAAVAPEHTVVVPEIEAIGNGVIVITAEPVWF